MDKNNSATLQMSEHFADLVFLALDLGVDSVKDGRPLIPFVVFEVNGERTLSRYHADTLEESIRQARAAIVALPATVSMCAIAYDGFVTVAEAKQDAIIVEAAEREKPHGIKLAQRYVPKKLFTIFRTVVNPLSLGECDAIFK